MGSDTCPGSLSGSPPSKVGLAGDPKDPGCRLKDAAPQNPWDGVLESIEVKIEGLFVKDLGVGSL